jgi:hypothetical protein
MPAWLNDVLVVFANMSAIVIRRRILLYWCSSSNGTPAPKEASTNPHRQYGVFSRGKRTETLWNLLLSAETALRWSPLKAVSTYALFLSLKPGTGLSLPGRCQVCQFLLFLTETPG